MGLFGDIGKFFGSTIPNVAASIINPLIDPFIGDLPLIPDIVETLSLGFLDLGDGKGPVPISTPGPSAQNFTKEDFLRLPAIESIAFQRNFPSIFSTFGINGAQPMATPVMAAAVPAVMGAGRLLSPIGLVINRLFARFGIKFSTKQLKRLVGQLGIGGVVTLGFLSLEEALVVSQIRSSRRGRGITASDIRRTKSTLRKISGLRTDLAAACGGVAGRSRRSAPRRRPPLVIAQN